MGTKKQIPVFDVIGNPIFRVYPKRTPGIYRGCEPVMEIPMMEPVTKNPVNASEGKDKPVEPLTCRVGGGSKLLFRSEYLRWRVGVLTTSPQGTKVIDPEVVMGSCLREVWGP